MTSSVGKALQKDMAQGKEPSKIAQKLLARNMKNPDIFLDTCRFLYLTGQNRLLLKISLQQLKKRGLVPWGFLIDVLSQQNIDLSNKQRLLFIKGIKEQNQILALLSQSKWDSLHPDLKVLKRKEIEKINRNNNSDFIKLMEDLHFVQTQGILKKEESILKDLKKAFPENPRVHELWLEFREKWGRHILQKKKKDLFKKTPTSFSPSLAEKAQAEQMVEIVLEQVKTHPQCLYDMALLFKFLNLPQKALKVLKTKALSSKAKWLYLELLLESRLYVECLHFLDDLRQHTKEDPEAIFALSYVQAQAYRGLGKKKKAYKILSELQTVRPHYRLAHCLLKQWEKEDL